MSGKDENLTNFLDFLSHVTEMVQSMEDIPDITERKECLAFLAEQAEIVREELQLASGLDQAKTIPGYAIVEGEEILKYINLYDSPEDRLYFKTLEKMKNSLSVSREEFLEERYTTRLFRESYSYVPLRPTKEKYDKLRNFCSSDKSYFRFQLKSEDTDFLEIEYLLLKTKIDTLKKENIPFLIKDIIGLNFPTSVKHLSINLETRASIEGEAIRRSHAFNMALTEKLRRVIKQRHRQSLARIYSIFQSVRVGYFEEISPEIEFMEIHSAMYDELKHILEQIDNSFDKEIANLTEIVEEKTKEKTNEG